MLCRSALLFNHACKRSEDDFRAPGEKRALLVFKILAAQCVLICLFSAFHRMLTCASIDKMAQPIRMAYVRRNAPADLQWRNGHQ
jgi:hypothetical protein